jgi:hypothetical protein
VQVAAVMASAHATEAEGMAEEKTALLVIANGEVAEATQRVSILGEELGAACQAWDVAEEKVLSLVAKVDIADQGREATEE